MLHLQVVLGLGLAITVAPLTSTALAAAEDRFAGIASGVNNTIARCAQVLAVAIVPLSAGISGNIYDDPQAFAAGFRTAMVMTAALAAASGVLALTTIRRPPAKPEPQPEAAARPAPGRHYCGVDGPPLATCPHSAVTGNRRTA